MNCIDLQSFNKEIDPRAEPYLWDEDDFELTKDSADSAKYRIEHEELFPKELSFIQKIRSEEQGSEDEYTSLQYFSKLWVAEFLCCLFGIGTLICSIIYYHLQHFGVLLNKESSEVNLFIEISLIIVTLINASYLISTVFRYLIAHSLKQSTQEITKHDTFWKSGSLKNLVLELLLGLFHPNLGFHNYNFTTHAAGYLLSVTYEVNDYMILIVLCRSYIIFRFAINCSRFYNARASRVSKMMGSKMTMLFAIRCLLSSYPFQALPFVLLIYTLVFGYMLYIVEGPVYMIDFSSRLSLNNLSHIQNCLWNVLVTMTTVGYGDYYPKTNLGRLIIIVVAIFGTIMNSLTIISLQASFTLTPFESNVYQFNERLKSKKVMQENSAMVFLKTFRFKASKRKYVQTLKQHLDLSEKAATPEDYHKLEQLANTIAILKNKTIECLYEKIKSTKEFKKIFHHFRNTHDPFTTDDLVNGKIKDINTKIDVLQKYNAFLAKGLSPWNTQNAPCQEETFEFNSPTFNVKHTNHVSTDSKPDEELDVTLKDNYTNAKINFNESEKQSGI